jgi:sugar phosphate isomerase/epimerase
MDDFLLAPASFPLSLHHLTVLDASIAELIAIAGDCGCAHVCLFAHVPEAARGLYPQVARADLPMLRDHLAAHNVSVCNLEVFPLDGNDDIGRFSDALQIGAALGATRATVHVHNADHRVAVQRFAAFCDFAADHGIGAGLEFNAFSAVRDARSAAAIVRAAARPTGALVLDMLHFFRGGGVAADVAGIADIVTYAQLCDGPAEQPVEARWHEAIRERLVPGAGEFAVADALARLNPATVIGIEVPQTAARKAGVAAADRARHAVDAARRLIDATLAQRSAA